MNCGEAGRPQRGASHLTDLQPFARIPDSVSGKTMVCTTARLMVHGIALQLHVLMLGGFRWYSVKRRTGLRKRV